MTEFSNQGSQLPLRNIKGDPRDHTVKGDNLHSEYFFMNHWEPKIGGTNVIEEPHKFIHTSKMVIWATTWYSYRTSWIQL